MADIPILFSGPMIRALLEGRKTQTRRVLGHHGEGRGRFNIFNPKTAWADNYVMDEGNAEWRARDTPYVPGDRLWVREAHALVGTCDPGWLLYRASGYETECKRHGFDLPFPTERAVRWRPSIHMPRWASRLTLIVTDVRVQRLQEISEEDAIAEGAMRWGMDTPKGSVHQTARENFSNLWDSLNAERGYGWDVNRWVCAVSFTVHRMNIDQMEAA